MIQFCKNCKHYRGYKCHSKSNIRTDMDYNGYYKTHIQTPSDKNADNNCTNFESSMLYKFIKFFYKKF